MSQAFFPKIISKVTALTGCLLISTFQMELAKAPAAINIYSARHYPTDEALYGDFTKLTGIKINRVDADDAGILARLKA